MAYCNICSMLELCWSYILYQSDHKSGIPSGTFTVYLGTQWHSNTMVHVDFGIQSKGLYIQAYTSVGDQNQGQESESRAKSGLKTFFFIVSRTCWYLHSDSSRSRTLVSPNILVVQLPLKYICCFFSSKNFSLKTKSLICSEHGYWFYSKINQN